MDQLRNLEELYAAVTQNFTQYDGTEFIFQAKAHKIDCSFYVTDEEFDLISKNDKHVVNSEIKAAVLSLFTKQE